MGALAWVGGGSAAPTGASILRAIVEGTLAWSSLDDLALAHGPDTTVEQVGIGLADLAAEGLAEAWDRGGEVVATLTPLGAARLRVALVEVGLAGRLVWRSIDDDEPAPARRGRMDRRDGECEPLDARLVDPAPGPAARAEAADDAEARVRSWSAGRSRDVPTIDRLPRPTVLLAGCQSTWTERRPPRPSRGEASKPRARAKARKPAVCPGCRGAPAWCQVCGAGVCPACKGAPLRPSVYCLRCGRWGLDGLARALRRAEDAAERARKGKRK